MSCSQSAVAGDGVVGIAVVCTNLKISAVAVDAAVVDVGKVGKIWVHLRHNILPLLEDLWIKLKKSGGGDTSKKTFLWQTYLEYL